MNEFPSDAPNAESVEEFLGRLALALEGAVDRRAVVERFAAERPELANEVRELANLDGRLTAPNATHHQLRRGDRLGEFRIVRLIAVGGMGEVYEAEQESLVVFQPHESAERRRRVAIKVIRSGKISDQFRARFLREQAVLARLHQTHVVPVHTAGQQEGIAYFAMPYIRGAALDHVLDATYKETKARHSTLTLGDIASRIAASDAPKTSPEVTPLNPTVSFQPAKASSRSPRRSLQGERVWMSPPYFRSVAVAMAEAADAVQHAHDADIVHRDLKPSNIMVDAHGHCWVIDFGLAGAMPTGAPPPAGVAETQVPGEAPSNPHPHTLPGVLGTIPYLAPEQLDGYADVRSDVYGLGATLYELCTWRPPFEPVDGTSAHRIRTEAVRPPRELSLNLPADLNAICLKSLAKSPDKRYQSAQEFSADLRRWLNDEPTVARPARALRRAWLWSRRNWHWAMILLVLLVVPSIFGFINYADKVRLARTRAHVEMMAVHNYSRARLLQPTHNQRTDILAALKGMAVSRSFLVPGPDADALDLETRSLAAAALALPEIVIQKRAQWPSNQLWPWPISIHPQGHQMVISATPRPVVWRRGEEFKIPADSQPAPRGSFVQYSPEGRWLLAADTHGKITVWNSDVTHSEAEWSSPEPSPALAMGFIPTSDGLVVATATGIVELLSLPRLKKQEGAWDIDQPSEAWTAAAFAGGNSLLAAGNRQGNVTVYEGNGAKKHVFPACRSEIVGLAWSPDGKTLASNSLDGPIRLWEVETWLPLRVMGADYISLGFTRDGWFIAGRKEGELTFWEASSGKQVLTCPFARASISADGQWLAVSTDRDLAFCELQRPEAVREYRGHQSMVQQVAWSADGRRMASIDNAFQIRIWDRNAPLPIGQITAPREHYFAHRGNAALALSEDGELLAFASGGHEISNLVMYNTANGEIVWQGTLPGAFEHLAATRKRQFLLIRDEREPGSHRRVTRQYDWVADEPPTLASVLREGEPDEAGTFSSVLSPDGRHFCWVGPRIPKSAWRVEVWDTSSGRVRGFPEPAQAIDYEPTALLSDDGQSLWVGRGEQPAFFDLRQGAAAQPTTALPAAVSSDGEWLLYAPRTRVLGRTVGIRLHRRGDEKPWLEIFDVPASPPAFSPDGRHLAWNLDNGTIKIADLKTLKTRIDEFENSVLRR